MCCPQDKCGKLQQVLGKAEEERKISRKQVEELEARLTQLELTRRGLEGDMQRLRLVIAERDAENQVRWPLCSLRASASLYVSPLIVRVFLRVRECVREPFSGAG